MIQVIAFFLLFTFSFGSGPLYAQENNTNTAAAGKALFQQRCGFCHGLDGSGGEGPDLLHSTLVLHDNNGELIGPVVLGSRQEKGMPAFPFAEGQIQDIAAFLHQEIKADATIFYTDSTSNYSLKKLLVGNAEAGKTYFNGAGKCGKCHASSGDLAHIASKYKPIDLQTRIAYPSGPVPSFIVTLPSGKKISGEQVYEDRFLVSIRDANGWIHTFQRDQVGLEEHDPLAFHKVLLTTYTDRQIHDLFAYLETLK